MSIWQLVNGLEIREELKMNSVKMEALENMRFSDRVTALEHEINGERIQKEMMQKVESYKKEYLKFLRGETIKNSLKVGTDGSGGYLVPDELEKKLVQALEEQNIIRKLATVITTEHLVKIPGVSAHGSAFWVEENQEVKDSDDLFYQVMLDAHKAGRVIRVSDELLEDVEFDIEAYLVNEFGRSIGELEESTFLTGDGNHKPYGLLLDADLGVTTKTLTLDAAIELYHSVSTQYREKASWIMSEDAFRILYKEKTVNGVNVWKASVVEGEPDTLFGRPVHISAAMPSVEEGAFPIAFGDFSYLWIGDRGKRSFKRLNELYATTGQVGFLASQRVDARLTLREAIKTLKITASN